MIMNSSKRAARTQSIETLPHVRHEAALQPSCPATLSPRARRVPHRPCTHRRGDLRTDWAEADHLIGTIPRQFGWFDPSTKSATPYDDNGHGTHTIATIVGLNGLGVAPGAKFISCRACTPEGCSEEDLLACVQFMTCPTDTDGVVQDCSQAPRLVSNSWGGGQADLFYAGAINTWQAAGIIPVFAIGNTVPGGPRGCGSAASPGDGPNVISVGATDVNDRLGFFSLKGPSKVDGLLKPEISAPGVSVRSAWNETASAVNTISGTSMATPHVSGVIALLLSKNPALTYEQAKTAITTTTDKNLKSTGSTCGGIRDTVYPNNQYGYGRINALAAFNSL